MFHVRRSAVVVASMMLAVPLGGCSSDAEPSGAGTASRQEPPETPSAASAERTAYVAEDVANPGEDLLGGLRQGARFTGATLEATWKFPTAFEPDAGQTTKAYTDDEHYRISIESGPGDQAKAAAATLNAQEQAQAKGQKTAVDTVKVAGKTFEVLVQDTPEVGIVTYAHAPSGGQEFYLVQFASDVALADVPQEIFDGFVQTVGSLRFDQQ